MPTEVTIDDFSSAVLDDASVSASLLPRNAVRHAVNVVFDSPRGAIAGRLGTTVLGDQAGGSGADVLGLYNHRSSTAAYCQLLAASSTTVDYFTGSVWTAKFTGLTTSLKTRFITYLDVVAVLNGTDAVKTWTGNTSDAVVTTGGPLDVANFPVTKVAVILKSRVLAIGNSTNPCRVYESSLPSAGAVSWTSGNRNVDVEINDGAGSLTSVTSNGFVSILFKERAMYRYDGDSLQKISCVGTTCHESVITDSEGVTYFFGQGSNNVGFYATTGGYPKKISRPIQKWVDAISGSFYASVAAETDGKSIGWSVGSVVIEGTTYTNAWLVYNISDRSWSCRNYADRFMVFSQYIDSSGDIWTVGGDTDGYVQKIDVGNTDNGTAIASEVEFGDMFFQGRGRLKRIPQLIGHARNMQGLTLKMRVDGVIKNVGGMKSPDTRFNSLDLEGRRFNLMLSCSNSNEPFIFEGITIPDVEDKGYVYG